MPDTHLTVKEVAEELHLSIKAIYLLIKAGKLSHIPPSGSLKEIRITREQLAKYVRKSTIRAK